MTLRKPSRGKLVKPKKMGKNESYVEEIVCVKIDLQSKSMDWFLHDKDLRHDKVNAWHPENVQSL